MIPYFCLDVFKVICCRFVVYWKCLLKNLLLSHISIIVPVWPRFRSWIYLFYLGLSWLFTGLERFVYSLALACFLDHQVQTVKPKSCTGGAPVGNRIVYKPGLPLTIGVETRSCTSIYWHCAGNAQITVCQNELEHQGSLRSPQIYSVLPQLSSWFDTFLPGRTRVLICDSENCA